MARDFSCALVTAENELLASAEGLPGPRHRHGVPGRGDDGAARRHSRRATRSCTTIPTSATRTRPTTRSSSRSSSTASTSSPPARRRTRRTAATRCRRRTCRGARDVYEEGALNFPCVRIQRDYRDIEDLIRMCRRRIRVPEQWYGDYLAALGAARIAERRLKELLRPVRARDDPALRRGVVRLQRAAHDRGDRQLPGGTLDGPDTHDPYPGLPDGIPLEVKVQIDAENGSHRDRSARQPGQLCGRAERVAGVRDEQRRHRRLQLDRSRHPAQRRQLPANRGRCCARAASPASRVFPTRARWRRRTSPIGSSAHPGRVRRPRRGVRARRGRDRASALRIAVVSGRDFAARRSAVRQPDLPRGGGRPGRPGGGRLADLHAARRRRAPLPRQHRGRRAEVPVPRPRADADPRLGGAGRQRGGLGLQRRLRAEGASR